MSNLHIFDDLWSDKIKNSSGLKFNFTIKDKSNNIVLLKEYNEDNKCVFKIPNDVILSEMGEYERYHKEWMGDKIIVKLVSFPPDHIPFLDFIHEGKYRSLAMGKLVDDDVQSIDNVIKEMI